MDSGFLTEFTHPFPLSQSLRGALRAGHSHAPASSFGRMSRGIVQAMSPFVTLSSSSTAAARSRAGGVEDDRANAARDSQLFFAPSRIHARIVSRSQVDSFFLPSGMWVSGAPRQSRSQTRLLLSGSPGITILPDFVPVMIPS